MSKYATATDIKNGATGLQFADYFTDPQLETWAETASSLIDNYCNRSFGTSSGVITETREGTRMKDGRLVFYTDRKPISSISSISLRYVGTTVNVDLDVSLLNILYDQGYAYYDYYIGVEEVLRTEYLWEYIYTIQYSTNEGVPLPIKQACVMLVANLLKAEIASQESNINQTLDTPVKSFRSGDYSVDFDTTSNKSSVEDYGYFMSPTIRMLLDHYVHIGQST